MEREVNLFTFVIVLWQDRLYPICDLSVRNPDRCEWFRQWDNRFVVASRCRTPVFRCGGLDGVEIIRKVVLRPEAGIPVTDSATLKSDPRAIALLATLRRDQDLIGLQVAPDSFDSFAVVKDFFLSNGFQYNCLLYTSPSPRDLSTSRMPSSA